MNETIFIRVSKKVDYTVIDNGYVKNEKLSWDAKGVMTYLLTLPSDWVINLDELTTHSSDGITVLRSALKELEQFGYLRITKIKNEKGVFTGSKYEISEAGDFLNLENPKQENPREENPISEKRALLNTKFNKILNKQNTESTNTLSDSLSQSESSEETEESSEANASSLSKKQETKPRKRASAKTPKATTRKTLTDEQLEDFFALIPDETHTITREIAESLIMINQRKDPHYFRSENFIKNKTKDIIEFLNNSGRTAQEAKDVFNFAIQDSFWVNVIISADVFIRNYEKLFQKMATKKNGGSTSSFSKPKQKVAYSSYEAQDYSERSF